MQHNHSPQLHRFLHNKTPKNTFDEQLLTLSKSKSQFCRNNPNIIFTRADKGNVTVTVDKFTYLHKMEEILSDQTTYSIIKKNPSLSLEKI